MVVVVCAGVPFLMQAGKGLDERKAEVRVRFKPNTRTRALFGTTLPGNELVMRIQPNEACYLTTYSREPGLEEVIKPTSMEMSWATQFPGERNNKHATVETSQSLIPIDFAKIGSGRTSGKRNQTIDVSFRTGAYVGDAYEKMLLSAAKGDGRLFVGEQELVQAWRIFTPLLHEIDAARPLPTPYHFNSAAPPGFVPWAKRHGVELEQPALFDELSPEVRKTHLCCAIFY